MTETKVDYMTEKGINKLSEEEEVDKLFEKAVKYHEQSFNFNKRYFIIHSDGLIKSLCKLKKNELNVLLYLLANINRDTGWKIDNDTGIATKRKVWLNLDKYYADDWLCTARTQKRIEKDLDISQANISRALKSLTEKRFIKIQGHETITLKGQKYNIPVYAMGKKITIGEEKQEVYFYELI